MVNLGRSASLTNFADVAARCSLDARALVREVGLPEHALEDPDLKVPVLPMVRLLELAAARGHEPAFGLKMAEPRRLSNLGVLGLVLRDEPTLGHALEALVQHIHLTNEALALRTERVGDLVSLHVEVVIGRGEPVSQAMDLAVGVTFGLLCRVLGTRWRPRLVCFSHRAPKSDLVYRRFFGTAVKFGHEFNGIIFDASDLDAPNPAADPIMSRYTHELLDQASAPRARLSDRVRHLVMFLLPRGYCRVEIVAQELGVDRRTVARGLASEGTTFSQLVDDVRRELLRRHHPDRSRPLSDVSWRLGFSSPSAFARWHRRYFGVTARSRSH